MGVFFLDTSALVKLYVEETGTAQVVELCASNERHTLALLTLSRVEIRSALRRRERAGDLSEVDIDEILDQFVEDIRNLFIIQPITDVLLQEAEGLVDRRQLRAYDAMQLAGCRIFASGSDPEPPYFVCADRTLLRAAVAEGVSVLNPES